MDTSTKGLMSGDQDGQNHLKRPLAAENTPTSSPLKRSNTDPSPSKRSRLDLNRVKIGPDGEPCGGKNGPKYPLPILDEDRPKLFIPKPNFDDNMIVCRYDVSTPVKPLFKDNDPSLPLPLNEIASPLPFPPSRQNSCNSLVRFSERLFEDSQTESEDSLSLPDIGDRFPRSPCSSESSGIQMRNTPTSDVSDGFTLEGTKETDISNNDSDAASTELESTLELENSEISTEKVIENFRDSSEPIGNKNHCNEQDFSADAIPSTSKCSKTPLNRSKTEQDTDLMFNQVQTLQDRLSKEGIEFDPNDLFLALERYRIAENRMNLVYEETVLRIQEDKLQQDLAEIHEQYPGVSPEILRNLLEKHGTNTDRKNLVKSELQAEEALVNDPLFSDLQRLVKIFPDRDKIEIHAYLKAKEQDTNRVDTVAEMLLLNRQDSKINDSLETENTDSQLEFLDEIESLRNIFPDADKNYLFEQLALNRDDPKRKEKLATKMAELRNYTKINERPRKGKRRKEKFILKDFVRTFPNAVDFFHDVSRKVNETYKRDVRVYLLNYYTSISERFIDESLLRHHGLLTPTFKHIHETVDQMSRYIDMEDAEYVFVEEPRPQTLPYSSQIEEIFSKELQFLEHEGEISNYMALVAKEKQRAKDAARASGDLMECQCCYDDEVLFEDMQACEDGHPFCIECIRMSAETAIGEGKTKFPCLSAICDSQFSFTVLKQLLKPEILAKIQQRSQEEEIRLAGIENLVNCPFCPFATIMEDETDKVFRCQNPECLKESCRLCQELNHVPLNCEEAKQDCTDMRTFIEKRVSEAMIRVCHSCGKRFYKNDGCNKMTCSCGATMCYVCREPDINYSHFQGTSCDLDANSAGIHRREMELAGKAAYEEYIRLHPDHAGKFDHQQLIPEAPGGYGDSDNDDDEEEDMDYDDDEEY